jgi:hypothetical protein
MPTGYTPTLINSDQSVLQPTLLSMPNTLASYLDEPHDFAVQSNSAITDDDSAGKLDRGAPTETNICLISNNLLPAVDLPKVPTTQQVLQMENTSATKVNNSTIALVPTQLDLSIQTPHSLQVHMSQMSNMDIVDLLSSLFPQAVVAELLQTHKITLLDSVIQGSTRNQG